MEMMTPVVPPTMNGFRRPQRLRVLSLKIPTIGWTTTPQRGAASQTRAVNEFESPRDTRYGFKQSAFGQTEWSKTQVVSTQGHYFPMNKRILRF